MRHLRAIGTSTGPAEILTDAGRAYLKALGNKEGPHAIAADWLGTAIADWMGLRTFAVAKLEIAEDDDIPLGHGRLAEPGTAIAFRAESGASWGGTEKELDAATNGADLSKLVVFDTWLLNCDRFPPDVATRLPNHNNVFLSAEGAPAGRFVLTAMDHTHCFSCGRELGARLSRIDNVKDPHVYGRFPEFEKFLSRELVEQAADSLSTLTRPTIEDFVSDFADDWQVTAIGRTAIVDLIYDRADFVAATIVNKMFS